MQKLNMKYLGFFHLAVLAASSISSGAFAKGGTSSGGGQSVIFPDGSVHLVDFLNPSDLPAQPVTDDFIREEFYPNKTRYVRQWAEKDTHFFDCAKSLFSSSSVSSLRVLSTKLSGVSVYQVQTRLASVAGDRTPDTIMAVAANQSSKIPRDFQEPLAAYSLSQLLVVKPFYSRLLENEKCGLAVHEGFRHLNQTEILEENLSTSEIEEATGWVANNGTISQTTLAKLNGLALAKFDVNAHLAALKKVVEAESTSAATKLKMKEVFKLYEGLIVSDRFAFGSMPSTQLAMALQDILFEIQQNLSITENEIESALVGESLSLNKYVRETCLNGLDAIFSENQKLFTYSILSNGLTGAVLDYRTKGLTWIDTWAGKFVTRLSF